VTTVTLSASFLQQNDGINMVPGVAGGLFPSCYLQLSQFGVAGTSNGW